jgi:hypothetical protein
VYAQWWAETQACALRTGDVASIRWYVVPGVAHFRTVRGDGVASYHAATRRIVVAEEALLSGPVVRHEMLHALLGDVAGHPGDAFLGDCAGVVSCRAECRREAGRPVPRPPLLARVAQRARELGRPRRSAPILVHTVSQLGPL